MEKEYVELVTNYLDKIAEKIGVTVEQVWPWLVKQQIVEAYSALILFGFFIILTLITIAFLFIGDKYKLFDWDEGNKYVYFFSILCIASLIGLIASGIATISEVPDLFNPEYQALKDLIRMAR
ncbi:hypothetical protein A2619_04470 [candidate division WWE3 bacterium RIFOXYD1_FULL_39_9]|uniref:DUF5671 domain-containing protein n=1 Tax=candidate division WWE3 bacterium RIFOXYD1_FULL_39_9 TaxID=1802649 RepID=A0A1F4X6R8_UNCKA|nr:MAG: hypothetical protein A2619_04470 [candidate division WWE3 bacterium RIFOXYD1_FULL_39_9]